MKTRFLLKAPHEFRGAFSFFRGKLAVFSRYNKFNLIIRQMEDYSRGLSIDLNAMPSLSSHTYAAARRCIAASRESAALSPSGVYVRSCYLNLHYAVGEMAPGERKWAAKKNVTFKKETLLVIARLRLYDYCRPFAEYSRKYTILRGNGAKRGICRFRQDADTSWFRWIILTLHSTLVACSQVSCRRIKKFHKSLHVSPTWITHLTCTILNFHPTTYDIVFFVHHPKIIVEAAEHVQYAYLRATGCLLFSIRCTKQSRHAYPASTLKLESYQRSTAHTPTLVGGVAISSMQHVLLGILVTNLRRGGEHRQVRHAGLNFGKADLENYSVTRERLLRYEERSL